VIAGRGKVREAVSHLVDLELEQGRAQELLHGAAFVVG
jgi:hypothetical protein